MVLPEWQSLAHMPLMPALCQTRCSGLSLPSSAPGPCMPIDGSLQNSKLAPPRLGSGPCCFRITSRLPGCCVCSCLSCFLPYVSSSLRPTSAQSCRAPSPHVFACAVPSAWNACSPRGPGRRPLVAQPHWPPETLSLPLPLPSPHG